MRKTRRFAFSTDAASPTRPLDYRDGETFWLLGLPHTLRLYYYDAKSSKWYLNGSNLNLYLHESYLKKPAEERIQTRHMVERFFHERACLEIEESLSRLEPLTGLKCAKLTVKKMIRDWGRCTPLGNITINQELVAYEKRLIDYVVLRELLHLQYDDSDPAFTAALSRCLPDLPETQRLFAAL
ncbi:MAG: M48 family metallopeptidase [Oscillospiraceae bacterium]|jgi:predicted metal-dependent hydrolase|nr:M48 family metallopeptidase [Oscillospiraceae bacterium]